MRKRVRGFTLVELLVVMAVIGVLIGLLLPVLATARKNAAKAKCANNLEQMKRFLDTYVAEWDGIMPVLQYGTGDNRVNWMEIIYPDWSGWNQYHNTPIANRTLTLLPEIFRCPAAEAFPCYAANWYVMTKIPPDPNAEDVYLSQVDNTATTIFVTDGISEWVHIDVSSAQNQTRDEDALLGEGRTRHLDGANYLILDGGVKYWVPNYNDKGDPTNNISSSQGLTWGR